MCFRKRLTSPRIRCHSWSTPGWGGLPLYPHLLLHGVSVMVHRTLNFQVYDKRVEAEGQYVILLYCIFHVKYILACVYIPPPFNFAVLRIMLTYQLGNPGIPLYLVGDLNCYLDPSIDKNPPVRPRKWHPPYSTFETCS